MQIGTKLTKDQAKKLNPDYVDYISGNRRLFDIVLENFDSLKKNQKVLTYRKPDFVIVKISSINYNDPRALDGPLVRVTDGEFSWRVDGSGYAAPI